MAGAERDDIVQEGMIGLFKAIRDYRFDQKASFKVFAELCINRQIISAIKGANRQKHRPLNSYVSLDKPFYDDGKERTLMDMLGGSRSVDPENLIVDQEAFKDIEKNVLAMLSAMEWETLCAYLDNKVIRRLPARWNAVQSPSTTRSSGKTQIGESFTGKMNSTLPRSTRGSSSWPPRSTCSTNKETGG